MGKALLGSWKHTNPLSPHYALCNVSYTSLFIFNVYCSFPVAPVAKVIPQTYTVTEGGNITLTCNTRGVPSPAITWTLIGQSGVVSQNSSLTVVNVRRPGLPDNIIQYQCTASNGVESPATATANITVRCKYLNKGVLKVGLAQ